ncbi:3-deoxy-D-manno-octulosonic-acid transferase [Hondaea fermentalgiana]|uniref:3-deoxy-D-manno-octulosonic-acid transferase n=1 Tax=Hondaea fermentalgiana TaxID=2315210 RepID=A0A2R5G290_9STRA|nr:3-deoxy-D-manno-octulosonic-acid transferase [Hondaea fermentalgiana]|eukprot:GBG24655.1 3-deoxy-D-manno-octulosonic-acid transferase [Hondaea fermentalgiana]
MERVSFGLAPLDFPHRVDCFLEAWKPDLVIWVESEFWPCTLHALHERQTPMILVNARLSQRSMTRWQLFSWSRALLASTLGCFDAIVARSDQDAKRIETALRAAPGLLSTRKPPPLIDAVVDLKTDDPFAFQEKSAVQSVDKVLMPIASTLRQRAWIAGSTHAGEEMELAKAHAELSSSRYGHTNLVTFIAPRHPERCSDASQDVRRALADVEIEPMVLLWSELAHQDAQLQNLRQSSCIIIVDSLGILAHLYRYVDVAFIGGSLPMSRFKGVHNAREALFAGCSLVLQGSAAQSIEPLVSGVVAVEDHVDLASRVHARLEKRLADPMPQQAAYATNSSAKSALAALSIVWEIILREERSHR